MDTIRLSATAARNHFFELLNQVMLGKHIIIERDNKEVAIISPQKKKFDWKAFHKDAEAAHGILKEYDPMDNPLRKPGAGDFLGSWDKDLDIIKGK